jgi:hypothetical protein
MDEADFWIEQGPSELTDPAVLESNKDSRRKSERLAPSVHRRTATARTGSDLRRLLRRMAVPTTSQHSPNSGLQCYKPHLVY